MEDRRVLVVGGGIGRLTAAIARGRSRRRVTPIEREPRFSVRDLSLAICRGQFGEGPLVDTADATAAIFARTAQPI